MSIDAFGTGFLMCLMMAPGCEGLNSIVSRRALVEGALCQTVGCRHWGGSAKVIVPSERVNWSSSTAASMERRKVERRARSGVLSRGKDIGAIICY